MQIALMLGVVLLVAIYWFDFGVDGFFAAVAAGFCLYTATLVHAVSGVKTPNAVSARTP